MVESKQAGWWVWLQWVLASTVGGATGWAVLLAAMRAVAETVDRADGESAAPFRAVGVVVVFLMEMGLIFVVPGFLVGALQWIVLRRLLPQVGRWVLATTLGMAGCAFATALVFSIGVGVVGESLIGLVVGAAVGGAVPGAMQWLILRRRVSRAGWWVVASMPGMCVGVVALMAATRGLDTDIPGVAAGGAVGGALYGAITGAVLVWLLCSRLPVSR